MDHILESTAAVFNDHFATCESPACFNALIEWEDIESGTCSEDCETMLNDWLASVRY